MLRTISLFFSLLLAGFTVSAADLVREQRIADEISDMILIGDPLTLKAGEVEFLAIHTEAETDEALGGVILVHGRGAHPDWNDVIQPLRSQLPDAGWETLSLQMPVASVDAPAGSYGALIPEAVPRIAAGVAFMQQRGLTRLAIVAHSLGARMAVAYLAAGVPEEVRGFVAVGLTVPDAAEPNSATLANLQRLTLPLLDIYGDRDIDPVLNTARARAAAARRAGNREYRQVEVVGADHFFNGLADDLVAKVRAWLKKTLLLSPGVQ